MLIPMPLQRFKFLFALISDSVDLYLILLDLLFNVRKIVVCRLIYWQNSTWWITTYIYYFQIIVSLYGTMSFLSFLASNSAQSSAPVAEHVKMLVQKKSPLLKLGLYTIQLPHTKEMMKDDFLKFPKDDHYRSTSISKIP